MKSQQQKIENALSMFELIRRLDKEFPLQYIICFHQIALHPGLSVTELSKKTGINLSTISRIIGALSKWRKNEKPFELITIQQDPNQRRSKQLFLSKQGQKLLTSLLKHIA